MDGILTVDDLRRAIDSNPSSLATRRKIARRARILGRSDMIPAEWRRESQHRMDYCVPAGFTINSPSMQVPFGGWIRAVASHPQLNECQFSLAKLACVYRRGAELARESSEVGRDRAGRIRVLEFLVMANGKRNVPIEHFVRDCDLLAEGQDFVISTTR